jgi:hypothetical protein
LPFEGDATTAALSTTSTLDSAATLAASSNVCEDKGESWDNSFFEEQSERKIEERFLDDIRNVISNVAVNHNTKRPQNSAGTMSSISAQQQLWQSQQTTHLSPTETWHRDETDNG